MEVRIVHNLVSILNDVKGNGESRPVSCPWIYGSGHSFPLSVRNSDELLHESLFFSEDAYEGQMYWADDDLSLYERVVLKRNRNYDPKLDKESKIEEAR
jgi:hypothetical protein